MSLTCQSDLQLLEWSCDPLERGMGRCWHFRAVVTLSLLAIAEAASDPNPLRRVAVHFASGYELVEVLLEGQGSALTLRMLHKAAK